MEERVSVAAARDRPLQGALHSPRLRAVGHRLLRTYRRCTRGGRTWQAAEQPSPSAMFPSSQSSPTSRNELQHPAAPAAPVDQSTRNSPAAKPRVAVAIRDRQD